MEYFYFNDYICESPGEARIYPPDGKVVDLVQMKHMLLRTGINRDLLDREGRAIGEGKASDKIKETFSIEMKVCRYSGSRFEHVNPMNVTAYKRMMNNWGDIIEVLASVKGLYLRYKGIESIGIFELYVISLAAKNLPGLYESLGLDIHFGDKLPPQAADIHKVFIGLLSVIEAMVLNGEKDDGDRSLLSNRIADFAEKKGLFIGEKEVCAGSAVLLVRILDLFFDSKQVNENALSEDVKDVSFKLFYLSELCACERLVTGFLIKKIATHRGRLAQFYGSLSASELTIFSAVVEPVIERCEEYDGEKDNQLSETFALIAEGLGLFTILGPDSREDLVSVVADPYRQIQLSCVETICKKISVATEICLKLTPELERFIRIVLCLAKTEYSLKKYILLLEAKYIWTLGIGNQCYSYLDQIVIPQEHESVLSLWHHRFGIDLTRS